MWASSLALAPSSIDAKSNVHVTGFELLPVRATERTVWLMVRLSTDAGLTGLGEASDAFGFANTTKQDALCMESQLRGFFELIKGQSPLNVEAYRRAIARRRSALRQDSPPRRGRPSRTGSAH